MITKSETGYIVNGQLIDLAAAQELARYIDWEYYREDILLELDRQYGEDFVDNLADEIIDSITERYKDLREDDESWALCADTAIAYFEDKLKGILNKKE